ncbi:SDR family oxidoreductase [Sphingorhabdus sp.]|uniref:SDR family oxidoreductase n=1 Tax=Sphingorhabdus sp. TaxID=1902408 RepID=UPI0035AFDA9F
MNLGGRLAVLTGATGKIGHVMARTLAELGADLLLLDRPASPFGQLKEEIAPFSRGAIDFLPCDLEDGAQRQAVVSALLASRRPVSVLVNNAAFVGSSDLQGWALPFAEQRVDTWRRAIEVNLTAVFDLCQGLLPLLQAAPGASVVNIGSIYGMLGPDWALYAGTTMANPAAYAASKGGLLQLTRWLATTLAPAVRVNAISPGGVWRGQPESFIDKYEARTPLGRMAGEEDFAGALAYLASDLSSYVTGQNLVVDGGWTAW